MLARAPSSNCTIVDSFANYLIECTKKLPHLIYFALATSLIISMFLCRQPFYSDLRSLKKLGASGVGGGGGGSDF